MDQSCDLPHGIIMDEILIRLPVKSLCRFKSVSKLWNSAISSHQFAKAQLNYHKQLNSSSKWVFFQHDENSWLLDYEAYDDEGLNPRPFDFSVRENINPGSLVSLGNELNANLKGAEAAPFGTSCGLVCFFVRNGDSIFLCNPILNHCRMISGPRPFRIRDIILCGFGYVSSIDDFKLVLGLRGWWRDNDRPVMYVFSLKENHWRMIEGGHQFRVITGRHVDRDGILVNERLHWWVGSVQYNNNDSHIFAFDLLHEVFEEIPFPKHVSYRVCYLFSLRGFSGICTIGGYLCFSDFITSDNMEIWILKQYGRTNSWVRLYSICVPSNEPPFHYSKCFGFTKTGKFLSWCCDGSFNHRTFLIDPNHSPPKVTMIGNFGGSKTSIVNYLGSLVSPFGLVDTTREDRKLK